MRFATLATSPSLICNYPDSIPYVAFSAAYEDGYTKIAEPVGVGIAICVGLTQVYVLFFQRKPDAKQTRMQFFFKHELLQKYRWYWRVE